MDIKNCGRKLAVITSRRHHDGGFEAVVPADTLWSVDPDRNPDARLFLLDAMRRNADVAVIDEDGSAHPDVLYPDLVAFKQDLRDARAEMQIIVIASEERFEPGDPFLAQLIGCGVYDIISEKDPRTLDRALGDLMASPTTAQQAAELVGSARPKGFFGLRKPRKKQKRGAKEPAAPAAPTISSSMEPAQAAQGRKPLTSAPSETAKVLQKLQDSGEIPAARPEPAPAAEPPAQAPSPVPEQPARSAPPAPAARAQGPAAEEAPAVREPQPIEAAAGPRPERAREDRTRPEPPAAEQAPAAPEPQAAPAPDPSPHAATAEPARRAPAPRPADPRGSIMTPDQVKLMETVRAAVAKEYEAREAALRREYDLKLGSAMRQGRRQRCVAVCSLVPAMTAEAAMEAVAYCKRALPGSTVAFVEHDGARLDVLKPYGAIEPGSGDAMPDIVVRDFGLDWRAAAEAEADARLLVLAPEPWEAGAQKEAFAAGAGAGMIACLPADGPMAERIALAITGDRDALALPDPNHFAAGPAAAPEAYGTALGEMVSLLASEMGAAARPAPAEPAEPERAPEPTAAEGEKETSREPAGRRGERTAAEDVAEEHATEPAPADTGGPDAFADGRQARDPGPQGDPAPAAPPAAEPARRKSSRGVSWVCFDTGEADGPYDLDSQPDGWLDQMRAKHPEDGQWVEIGAYEEAGGGLRWKSLAQVRNETAQVKGKAERVAAKRRAKQARA